MRAKVLFLTAVLVASLAASGTPAGAAAPLLHSQLKTLEATYVVPSSSRAGDPTFLAFDDFVVPQSGWVIQQAKFVVLDNNRFGAVGYTLRFFNTKGGRPFEAIYTDASPDQDASSTQTSLVFNLDPTLPLNPGRYWASLQANRSSTATAGFGIRTVRPIRGLQAHRSASNNPACTTPQPLTTCSDGMAGLDLAFELRGMKRVPELLPVCEPNAAVPTGYTLKTGTNEANTINGTAGKDLIRGLGGNDTIRGAAGADIVCGNAGNDVVYGDAGNDEVAGGIGNDRMFGGNDDDDLWAGWWIEDRNDILECGAGYDVGHGWAAFAGDCEVA